ncbi:MAG: glycoside hydrolase family 38 C-terminal domain-containing protein [bacterium]
MMKKQTNGIGKRIIVAAAAVLFFFLLLSKAGPDAAAKPEWQKCDPQKDKVLYVVGYAHLDTQWRWTYQDSIYKYIPNTMHFNFDLLDKYPDYRFNFTGARRYMMMKEYYPADYQRVKDYIAKDRWYLSGSSVDENDANVPTPESVIRHVLYGNHYFLKEFNKTSEDYMLPDCFGFPASLPSALAHAGLKGFSTQKLTWGSPVGIPFNVGVWEGLDGRGLAAALNPGSYGSTVGTDLSKEEVWLDRINETGKKSGFYADFKYYGTGDVGGSPTEGSVKWVQESVNSDGPVCVVSAASDQIFKAITPDNFAKLPRYKGDLLLKEHSAGSLTSQAYIKRWNRKNELLIDNAERASVIADWLGGAGYPLERLNQTWYLILGNQMHDILPGTSVPKAYEFSWNDEVIALNNSASMLETAAGAAARLLDTQAKGVAVVVYNPLAIAREDIAQAKIRISGASAARVFDAAGAEVPSQVIEKSGDVLEVAFLAKAPSVGFAVYDVRKSDKPCSMPTGLSATKNSLENNSYSVRLDANGDVSSVYDKTAGRELLAAPARLAMMEDSPKNWPAWNIDWDDWNTPPRGYAQGPAKIKIVENGPARVALEVVRDFEGSSFAQTIRLAAGSAGDRLEFDAALDWRTMGTAAKASFKFAASNPMASYNLGMGVIERPNNNSGKYEVPSRQWLDLTDASGGFGTAVLEDSKFGSDKPDDNTLRLTLVRTPRCRGYCDQETQDLGRHRVLYALAGHKGDWRESGISWRGARLNQPLIAFTAPAHKGPLGKSFSFMKISSAQVGVSALKKAEDSDEIIVRLQELYGRPADGVAVSFAAPVVSARELDGQEREIGAATVRDGSLIVDMTGFSPRTFAVKLSAAKDKEKAPESTPINLAFDIAAASGDGEKTNAGFDGKGNSYPAEMLPKSVSADGIEFKLGPAGAGKKNALSCKGQTLSIPAGKYNRLYLLASSSGGDVKGDFKVNGKAAALKVQEWTGYVGQWDNRIWKNDREIYGLKPAFTKRAGIAWFISHRHNSFGENLAYEYSYIFKYKIDLPANAKSVTLPNAPGIRIFAATAAYNENDETAPAQLLYDDFEKPSEAPRIEPAAGKYDDTVKMTIRKSWYAGFDEVRYSIDGSEPTAKSPLYRGPVWILKSATVKARAFGTGGSKSPLSTAVFEVKDSTPPGVSDVAAFDGVQTLIVRFSEPVEKASAEKAANYRVDPDLGIESVALNPDGNSVTIKTATAPKLAEKYELTVEKVRDVSAAANAIKSAVTFKFTMTPPIFELKFQSKDQSINMGMVPQGRGFSMIGNPKILQGRFGAALELNGEDQSLSFNDKPELNPDSAITVSSWIKPEDWNGNRRILQKGGEDNQYRLYNEVDKLAFDISGVGVVTGPLPSAGEWHHIAGTYDGAAIRLYVDGKQVGETAASGKMIATTDSLFIGAKSAGSAKGDFFKGVLDKITIWNYALSPSHIGKLANPESAKK